MEENKGSTNTVVIIIVVVLVVLSAGGYFVSKYIMRRASDKITEGIISAGTGANVKVDSGSGTVKLGDSSGSIEMSENAKWPSDMPSSVPEYKQGKIVSSVKLSDNGGSWSVTISETSQTQFDAYKKAVEAAGWANDATADFGAMMSEYTKDNYRLTVIFDPSSNGASIAVYKETE